MCLDRHEARHNGDDSCAGAEPELAPQLARVRFGRVEAREIEPERDDLELLRAADPEAENLVSLALPQHDNTRGDAREICFEPDEQPCLRGREVSVEDVAVERVDADGHAGEPGGRPADRAGLGRVRVNDVRPRLPEAPVELEDDGRVAHGRQLAAERRNDVRLDAVCLCEREHVPLVGGFDAGDELGVYSPLAQAARQQDSVDCGAADVEARDDALDAQSWLRSHPPPRSRGRRSGC